MNSFKKFLIFYLYYIICQPSYGRKFHSYTPDHKQSNFVDKTEPVEKRNLNVYPESTINHGSSQMKQLFKRYADIPKETFQKLTLTENKKNLQPIFDPTNDQTLEMKVGEHLVKVKSKKESKNLVSAPVGGGYDISINPKYSHVIEIIHKGKKLNKQDKPAQIYDPIVEKQPIELPKIIYSEKVKQSDDQDREQNINFDPEVFSEAADEDPEVFSEAADEDPEVLREIVEEDSEDYTFTEFSEPDEGDFEEFGEPDEGDSEEFGEPDEGDSEEFGEPGEGDSEEFGEPGEGDSEEFGEPDEVDSEEFVESDSYPDKSKISGEYPQKVNEDGKEDLYELEDHKKFGEIEKKNEIISPNDISDSKNIEDSNRFKQNGTENFGNKEESELIVEFEGSGDEFSDVNGRNDSKTGRILSMFSRQNETFPICTTPKGEAGKCRRLGECLLSEALNNFNGFLQQLCLIRGALVGICCPDNPVIETVNPDENSTNELKSEDIKQPPEGCGLNTKTRIVGGTISVPHEWTWMVALMRRNRFYCGGVIINNWYILTAAHCVMGMNVKDLTVRLGEYDFNEQSKHTEDLTISEIKRHAQFVTLTFQHDIALLKLMRSIKYSKFVGSICLPEQKARDYSDAKGTVVGWGTVSFGGAASPILRQVTVPVWKNEDCDKTYLLENIGDSFMCAGSPEKGEDACQGDSGGPLMTVNENSRWEVIGLVSWGRRCGDPTYPGVYTRVTTYLDWIKQNAV